MDSKYFYFKMMEIVDLAPLSPTVPSNFPDQEKCSVQSSHSVMSDSLWLHEPQHTRQMLAWSKSNHRHLASLYVLQIP